jgi:hypothetical protein
MQKIYFKPLLDGDANIAGYSKIGVYRYYENAKGDFYEYRVEAIEIEENDLPLYVILDDEEGITPTYFLDIPNSKSNEWINIRAFKTRQEAIALARELFDADENGMVCLIS